MSSVSVFTREAMSAMAERASSVEGDVLSCLHQEYTFFSLATVVFLALSYLIGSTLI